MNNYFFSNIGNHRNDYPDASNPDVNKKFLPLEEYITIAKKIIKKIGPMYTSAARVKMMLNSEDYISELARYLMIADWKFEEGKGKTQYSLRNEYAIHFFKDRQGKKSRTKANKPHYSLDVSVDDSPPVSAITEDFTFKNPIDSAKDSERRERIRDYVEFLINNSKLTRVQKECIRSKYIYGMDSYDEIGKSFNPPISRQAAQQALNKAIFKIQQTAKGTKVEPT